MLNWLGMLAWFALLLLEFLYLAYINYSGLALEAMLTVLTTRFVPFFLILWIISNVSVSVFPIQVLPHVYRYGYAFPFYNVSRAIRAIIFTTKNDRAWFSTNSWRNDLLTRVVVGLNFGILVAWVVLSCFTVSLFQWLVRRRAVQPKTTEV